MSCGAYKACSAIILGGPTIPFVSTDARTFKEPSSEWQLGTWNEPASYFEGSPQSLTGDLIREGVSGVAGHVAEPYLDGAIRPDILLPAYFSGFTLAEAYFLAMPHVSWQTIVVGDPLCVVATRTPAEAAMLDPGVDPETELPRFFSVRRVEVAESRLARGDADGIEEPLLAATKLDPALPGAQVLLANRHERRREYDEAAARYRAVLASDTSNVIALNNLAYLLAAHQGKAADALPLAERALRLAPGNSSVADTLAWVHHLLGNGLNAARYIQDALRADPSSPEANLHAAFIWATGGDQARARAALARALELKPGLGDEDDVQQLQTTLRDGVKH
jgi:Tfp pilus assembly protein PilF